MTLLTTDYLEYYLTLVAWIVHNGIWAVVVTSGVTAVYRHHSRGVAERAY
ncbi:hypothetical protein [Pectobacterium odoriferum]